MNKLQAQTTVVSKAIFLTLFLLTILINYAQAQRGARNRVTGERIHPCAGADFLGCDRESGLYGATNLECLKCLEFVADSTMSAEYSKLLERLSHQKTRLKRIQKNQEKWLQQKDKMAAAEGNKYKGGTMEITEPIRMAVLQTEKRIRYLRTYKS